MYKLKEKGINLILMGISFQFIPLVITGLLIETFPEFKANPHWSFILAILVSFFLGYGIFIKGCGIYIKSKGYASNWGWLGIFSFVAFLILFLIPSRTNQSNFESEKFNDNLFNQINIPELLLFLISLPFIYGIFLSAFSLNDLKNSLVVEFYAEIFMFLIWMLVLIFKVKASGLKINQIIGNKNLISVKLIVVVTVMDFAFNRGLNSLMLYQLSFIVPKYVEYIINKKSFSTPLEMALFIVSVIVLAPLLEEVLCRGIILQKWGIKWGIKVGVITSSLFFALLHFRYDIITLFILGVILAILYLKTHNLISSILCHCFYNTLFLIFGFLNYFMTPGIERNTFISISEYQNYNQPLLGYRIFLIAISLPFLIYFIYKNFPKNDSIIPYYANNDDFNKVE